MPQHLDFFQWTNTSIIIKPLLPHLCSLKIAITTKQSHRLKISHPWCWLLLYIMKLNPTFSLEPWSILGWHMKDVPFLGFWETKGKSLGLCRRDFRCNYFLRKSRVKWKISLLISSSTAFSTMEYGFCYFTWELLLLINTCIDLLKYWKWSINFVSYIFTCHP